MALARIITRSQTCSRELALVLRARGYAVEIVAPDGVPENVADLELRVDAGPANELIANVEAHNGERTTTLEFVHHLKAPIADFELRSSFLGEVAHTVAAPKRLKTAQDIEELGASVEVPPGALAIVPPAAEIPPIRDLNTRESISLVASRTVLPRQDPRHLAVMHAPKCPSAPFQPTTIQPSTIRQTMPQPTPAVKLSKRLTGFPWRAGMAFAGMVLLAMVLEVGVRSGGNAASPGSGGLPLPRIVAPPGVNSSTTAPAEKGGVASGSAQISAATWALSASDSESNSEAASTGVRVAQSGTTNPIPKNAAARKRGDDLIARDTTIYFDKRFEPGPKTKRTKPIVRRPGDRGKSHQLSQ